MNSLLVFCLFALGAASDSEELKKIDDIQQEKPCVLAGGICTIATDCPAGHLSETRGLCPQQKGKGIECCHGISMKETRCVQHGGSCLNQKHNCNPRQIYLEATDCPPETKCCVMIF